MDSPRHPRFPVHRCAVRDGVEIGYWRAGEGGYPLLLVHGFPETKRIWARNVAPLAEAGFDVIAPDLRGVGDSDPAPTASTTRPHTRAICTRSSPSSASSAAARWPATSARWWSPSSACASRASSNASACSTRSRRRCPPRSRRPGSPRIRRPRERPEMDYFVRQGSDADGLLAELDTPEQRRAYVGAMYAERGWAAAGAFTPRTSPITPSRSRARPRCARRSRSTSPRSAGVRSPSRPCSRRSIRCPR